MVSIFAQRQIAKDTESVVGPERKLHCIELRKCQLCSEGEKAIGLDSMEDQ